MTDRPDVELTARYPLADTTTAADLAELLLTVPADARIGFSVPIPSTQSYADTPPPQQPRTMTATWTVSAGQPLTPPNTDDVPAAAWAVPGSTRSALQPGGIHPAAQRCLDDPIAMGGTGL